MERSAQLNQYAHERRLRAIEAELEIEPEARDLVKLPVVRVVVPDAMNEEALKAAQKKTEDYFKTQMEDLIKAATEERLAERARAQEEMKVQMTVAIQEAVKQATAAATAAAPAAAPAVKAPSVEDFRAMIREALAAETAPATAQPKVSDQVAGGPAAPEGKPAAPAPAADSTKKPAKG